MKTLEENMLSQEDLKVLLSELLEMGNQENATASALIEKIRTSMPKET
ncbi:hypothetical protein [Alteribacter natronophilus]|nr:hypothetical protein [Alteribacter natronophilus]